MDWKVLIGSKILLLTLISTSVIGGNEDKKVVCYYTNWSVYRPGTAKFSPQNINPYLCTHLIYAFGGFTKDNTLKPFDKYQDIDKGGYAKFTGLKTYNKDLKTLLAIGGWNEASSRFSPMVADPQRRRQFVKSVVKFLRQNHFDGLDLDWEYPAFRDGGKPRDKDNYASFVQELREEFEKESSKTGRPRLLLTMAVPAGIEYIDKGYNIPKLNQYLDFINLLSYDYHSAYEPAVNHHSPLYPLEEDNEYNYDNELTIDYTIKHLIKSGASPEKIIMGIPTYGRSYTLFNEDAYTLGSPADGPGAEGDATREKGYLAYYEICESIENDDWVVEKPNPTAMGPYAYKNNQWVGYDDEDIVRVKAKYVNEKNLGGIMFWSIDNDDFRGKCHGRSYPLIEAAKEALFEENGIQKEDERSNTNGSRKRNRISVSSKSSSQLNSRKSNGVINRKNTLSRPSSEKRLSTSSSSKFRNRFNSKTTDDLNEENNENSDDVISTRTTNKSTRTRLLANKNRSKTRSNIGDRDDRKKQLSSSTSTHKSSNNKITTPEPPTTPDPGSDFKCEDEGFFSHPRDCKKYFWCLDSGPSGLGIVANQFTCPSGLVFNKVADSCDYPRNVICPKMKAASTTTERTTTEKEEDEIIGDDEEEDDFEDDIEEDEEDDIIENKKLEQEKPKKVSTTVRPLLYKTINRSRPTTTSTTTTTTTTLATTSGPVKLAEDVSEEQDPRVIKELIDLIKKAGGIEQLEKQLALQEKTVVSGSTQGNGQVTPATISKSLYERVLNRQSSKSNLLGLSASRLSSRKNDETENKDDNEQTEIKISNKPASNVKFLNGPGRSQFEGLDEVPEVKSLRRSNKPKYVTIERHSSLTTSTKIDEELDEEDDEADEDEDNEDVASSEEKQISDVPEDKVFPTQRSTPGYVNIRRTRPTTTTEKSRVNTDIKEVNSIANEEQSQTHHSVRRTSFRPTEYTTKEKVEESTTPKARYISINRFRSTTITPRTASDQINTERFSTKPVTIDGYNEKPVPEEKTINATGESGRISIAPFTTDTPLTTRTLSDDSSPKIISTSPYTEDKLISTQYTTKPVFDSTTPLNPNIIEDTVTESLLTTIPIELSTTETVAEVSQPRPFGFPRRTRPTTAASITHDTAQSTLTRIESTSKPKVLDEPILPQPIFKDFTAYENASIYVTEHPKKTNTINNSLNSKPENNSIVNPLNNNNSALIHPLHKNNMERIVKVPVRFVDGPADEYFLLQIPETKLNISEIGSVLKIEVVKLDEGKSKNINIFENFNETDVKNKSIMLQNLGLINNFEPTQRNINVNGSKIISKYNNDTVRIGANTNENNTKLLKIIENTIKSNAVLNSESFNPLNIKKQNNLYSNSTLNDVLHTDGNPDIKEIKSAIYNSQNSSISNKQPFFNNTSIKNNNNQLSEKNFNSTETRKVHRQRILIYRGTMKYQPSNSSSQRRWLMKKVIRRRIRPTELISVDDLEANAAAPVANEIGSVSEVNTSRNPGLNLFRRPGESSSSRSVYTSISPATLSASKKIYPVKIGIENTRVVGIMADQSGNPQNLELILTDPPASISSTTDSGRAALTRPGFRRKISTTISPRSTEEIPARTSSSRIISSERRRQGQKYDSDRMAVQNSYQIPSRPYKPAVTDYDYYDDDEERFVGKLNGQAYITSRGLIKCLDQGNFPHPSSCKKFITCAKMVNGRVIGTEYTCPNKLSFDPIGGICNWSAGLGCNE